MYWNFEESENISDYDRSLNIYNKNKSFFEKYNGWFFQIDHHKNSYFPDPVRYEVEINRPRILLKDFTGTSFDSNSGEILAKPIHKIPKIAFDEKEKRVGDWIIPFLKGTLVFSVFSPKHNGARLSTRSGITKTAMEAEVFSADKNLFKFLRDCYNNDYTPSFVWTEDKDLVLAAMRETISGKYMSLENLEIFAAKYHVTPITKFAKKEADGNHYKVFENGHRQKVII